MSQRFAAGLGGRVCRRGGSARIGASASDAKGAIVRETLRRLVGYFRIEHALFLVPIFGFAIYDSVFSAFSISPTSMKARPSCR